MIDARKFSFKKIVFPKTSQILSINDIAIGYFDYVKCTEIHCEKSDSASKLMSYYNCDDELCGCSFQNFFAFTNTHDSGDFYDTKQQSFHKEFLKDFWDDNDAIVRYYSLLHLSGLNSKTKIKKFLNWLNYVFNKEEKCAVFYFSFDYSDIIICTKNISVERFNKTIFKINYESQSLVYDNFQGSSYIKDSFSVITLNNCFIKNVFDYIQSNSTFNKQNKRIDSVKYEKVISYIQNHCNGNFCNIFSDNNLTISYNIGVRNFNLFEAFCYSLKSADIHYEKYYSLGRHDITIFKKDTSLTWLIMVLYFIDKYTTLNNELQIDNKNDILFSCESSVKISLNEILVTKRKKYDSIKYNKLEKKLSKSVQEYKNALFSIEGYKKLHITPIISLEKSILDVINNEFATDFIICIFESFICFLDYMKKQIEKGRYKEDGFEETFNTYFRIVNSLVNSEMHSERHFVQIPSFNPVFYEVPPKLLAFYTAITKQIVQINSDEKYMYSFVFEPSFSKDISILHYSFFDKAPTDRLLLVSINEAELYNLKNVIMVMCHEVAHYVGTLKRNRELRKSIIIKILLFILFKQIFMNITVISDKINRDENSDNIIIDLADKILSYIETLYFYKQSDYLENIYTIFIIALQEISSNVEISKIINDSLIEHVGIDKNKVISVQHKINEYIKALSYSPNLDKPDKINSNNYMINVYKRNFDMITSVFKEIYADVQMILIMGLSYKDYIKSFTENSDVTFENFKIIDADFYRIFNVVFMFSHLGVWKIEYDDKENDSNYSRITKIILKTINKYKNEISTLKFDEIEMDKLMDIMEVKDNSTIDDCHSFIVNDEDYLKHEGVIDYAILSYLIEVTAKSCNDMSEKNKLKQIKKFRKNIKTVIDFENSIDVFFSIQKQNVDYINSIIENEE